MQFKMDISLFYYTIIYRFLHLYFESEISLFLSIILPLKHPNNSLFSISLSSLNTYLAYPRISIFDIFGFSFIPKKKFYKLENS